jgi:hypothetical protein
VDTCAEGIRLKRLGAIGDSSFFEKSPFNLRIRIPGDEYRRRRMASRKESVKELDSAHMRHAHVENQTAGLIYRIGREKLAR